VLVLERQHGTLHRLRVDLSMLGHRNSGAVLDHLARHGIVIAESQLPFDWRRPSPQQRQGPLAPTG
jgi:hypothetical protein